MKKCPFCKADIEDNARFCLYCMKPLNKKEVLLPQKKQKRWLLAIAGVLVLALLVGVLLVLWKNAEPPAQVAPQDTGATGETTASQVSEPTAETTQPTQGGSDAPQEDPTAITHENPGKVEAPGQAPVVNPPATTPTTKPTQPQNPTQDTTPPASEHNPPEETTEDPTQAATEETQPETTQPETTQPEAPKSEVVYTYRMAERGDDFSAHYTNSGSDIVITGISRQSSDGTYDIPAYIDGKKVIAIVANAFTGSNARVVYVPATVKTIRNYAFYGCSLTDIYFRGNAIYTEFMAFSSSLTIHCSASCNDRNLRYYKDSAAYYDATWSEWNG